MQFSQVNTQNVKSSYRLTFWLKLGRVPRLEQATFFFFVFSFAFVVALGVVASHGVAMRGTTWTSSREVEQAFGVAGEKNTVPVVDKDF